MTKRTILCSSILISIAISFLLFFYNFTTSEVSNLYLAVDYENSNGWDITGLENGREVPLTATEAIDSTGTVFLRRTVLEEWVSYDRIKVDSGRAILVFVDEQLVFSNHPTNLSQPGELPLMQKPQEQPFFLVFSFQPAWVGKTITVVTRLYDNEPFGSIDFNLENDSVAMLQHEAWVNQHALFGAMFGILSLLLFGLFLFQLSTSKRGYPILFLAVAALLQMLCYMSVLNENPFPWIDSGLATAVYFLFPLLYLGTKIAKSRKAYFVAVIFVWSIYVMLYTATFVFYLPVPYWFDKLELLCFVLLGIVLYFCVKGCRSNAFLRNFLRLLGVFGAGYVMLFLIASVINHPLHETMVIIMKEASCSYVRPLLFWIFTTILLVLFILSLWTILQDRILAQKQLEQLRNEQTMLHIQMEAAKGQLCALRSFNEQTIIYRHDMRHHLNLLFSFAEDDNILKIKEYLKTVQSDIEEITPVRYCENEVVNLILASFDTKASKNGISLCVKANLPNALAVNETELCSLFCNGLENAITAVSNVQDETLRKVDVCTFIENEKLMISIKNAYLGSLEMDGELPKSQNKEAGHGFGVKSMVAIVERHGGLYSIKTADGEFVLSLMLPLI